MYCKSLLILLCACLLLSCQRNRNVTGEIDKKIAEFYSYAEVKEYRPINTSVLDTIKNIRDLDGNMITITGTVKHKFSGLSRLGTPVIHEDVFDVSIFKDDVIVIPRGYE